jgi:hypothetical protein
LTPSLSSLISDLMELDAYTKIVLTIIAVCLVWICLKHMNLLSPATSEEGTDKHRAGFTGMPFATL